MIHVIPLSSDSPDSAYLGTYNHSTEEEAGMNALFVALGIMVLALLALLLWFVPHLLQQQAARVSGETAQLREMLLDLLNEQEAVAVRQAQLGNALSSMQFRLETLADAGPGMQRENVNTELIDARISELQSQIAEWLDGRQRGDRAKSLQDNESWANLLGLLAAIQERVGLLSEDRVGAAAGARAGHLLEELEQEMNQLRLISEDISRLQQRLKRSLNEHSTGVAGIRNRLSTSHVDTLQVG
jgi:DNA repair exonuclease SbcCD ATPase subunit